MTDTDQATAADSGDASAADAVPVSTGGTIPSPDSPGEVAPPPVTGDARTDAAMAAVAALGDDVSTHLAPLRAAHEALSDLLRAG